MSDEARETRSEQGSISQLATTRELGSPGNTFREGAKFELGAPRLPFDGLPLPWSYGDDRITAMVRSPDSLYLYWEITDDGIADARKRLGAGHAAAHGWCNLRVYDTTGHDFDGTNANDYFDVRVERTDRDYFLNLDRPTASFQVEIGIKSEEGFFQAIARSGRADFPRKGPSGNHALEWMTVTSEGAPPAARPFVSRYAGPPPGSGRAQAEASGGTAPAASNGVGGPLESRTFTWTHPSHVEVRWEGPWISQAWRTEWRLRWIGARDAQSASPIETAQWVVGPFPLELLAGQQAGRLDVRFLGDGQVVLENYASGIEVFGPWEVRIQSFETGSERRTLGSWRVHWVRVEPAKVERWWAVFERARLSAWAGMRSTGGASESRAIAWAGASEVWRMGASERWSAGASEWMAMGGSEVARAGASELLFGGASALLFAGASAMAWGGASELAWGGASEARYGGASEARFGGASELTSGTSGTSRTSGGGAASGANQAYTEWLEKLAQTTEAR
jgi:hypothetical protein